MKPYVLHQGDCLEVLKTIPDNSFDSIVCDPPYGLSKEPDMAEVLKHWLAGDDYQHKGAGFMGKSWDSFVPGPSVWRECLRVLKPGGHLLSFFGTRTYDMGVLAIRLAGFEIRDQIAWVYGSGFPKSQNVSKAIDKSAGAERQVLSQGKPVKRMIPGADQDKTGSWIKDNGREYVPTETAPATEDAQQWEGWGTALKPAQEPIVVARKPLTGTVAANVLTHGTGALNIDGCRVGTEGGSTQPSGMDRYNAKLAEQGYRPGAYQKGPQKPPESGGRWPANLILDGSEEVLAAFPDAKGQQGALTGDEPSGKVGSANCYGKMDRRHAAMPRIELDKSAARFFYHAKASRADRNAGLVDPGPQFKHGTTLRKVESAEKKGNLHSTVKPTALMRYLCRLVTPPAGTVLDPYMGSGSTGRGALLEGFQFIGIELSEEYMAIAESRIAHAQAEMEAKEEESEQLSLLDAAAE